MSFNVNDPFACGRYGLTKYGDSCWHEFVGKRTLQEWMEYFKNDIPSDIQYVIDFTPKQNQNRLVDLIKFQDNEMHHGDEKHSPEDDISDAKKSIEEFAKLSPDEVIDQFSERLKQPNPFLGKTNPMILRETFLDKAKKLIYGQRQKDYGPAKENYETIAKLWSAFLGIEISWKQVPAMMILMKTARLKTSIDHEDSWIDIAGYVGVYDKGVNGE